ncbi:hypothetical protein [Sphingomonas melonis]|uniref:hypothetical protein n=1 Tax=Sphingomonas melonis TaxID=152682 RepID=UPI0035C7BB60
MATLSLYMSHKAKLELRLTSPIEAVRQAALTELIGETDPGLNKPGLWTLAEYVAWLNRPEPGIIKGELMSADEWEQELGFTKASHLADYLDDCVAHEKRKDGY